MTLRILMLVLAFLSLVSALPLARPTKAQSQCPLIGTEAVSAIVGSTVEIDDLLITGTRGHEHCVFLGETTVVLGRDADYFDSEGLDPLLPDQLRRLSRLNTDAEMVFTSESGIGDLAIWARVADPTLQDQYFPVLIVRRGADAFYFSIDDSVTPNTPEVTKKLGNAVLAFVP